MQRKKNVRQFVRRKVSGHELAHDKVAVIGKSLQPLEALAKSAVFRPQKIIIRCREAQVMTAHHFAKGGSVRASILWHRAHAIRVAPNMAEHQTPVAVRLGARVIQKARDHGKVIMRYDGIAVIRQVAGERRQRAFFDQHQRQDSGQLCSFARDDCVRLE